MKWILIFWLLTSNDQPRENMGVAMFQDQTACEQARVRLRKEQHIGGICLPEGVMSHGS